METTIRGIRCELETWVEGGEPRSSLFLYKALEDGSEFSGSLQLTEHFGGIPYDQGGPPAGPEVYPVSDRVLEEIEAWGLKHGY
ncbi:MAG: hypothetical protein GX856_03260 [Gammaproteobacteria bacterium]|jgi:hypothetical protein|nr:hypothetical protein [Gammaproteobacteria bacterium]